MILADMIFPAPGFLYVMGIVRYPIMILAIACEVLSICIFIRKQCPSGRAALQVTIANIVSAVIGFLVVMSLMPSGLTTKNQMMVSTQSWSAIAAYSFIAYFLCSVIIEGAYYRYVWRPVKIPKPYTASLIGNFVSYGILAIVWIPTLVRNG